MKKRIPAILLAAMLVVSTLPAYAASINPNIEGSAPNPLLVSGGFDGIQYLSLGDSIAYGYGLEGFYEEGTATPKAQRVLGSLEGSYPNLIRTYLECGDDNFVQGAVCGFRVVDVCTVLGMEKYPGDKHYEESIYKGLILRDDAAYNQDYIKTVNEAVKKADFITITVGGNDVYNQLTSVIMEAMGSAGDFTDWERFYDSRAVESYNKIKNFIIKQAKAIDSLSGTAADSKQSSAAMVRATFNSLQGVLYSFGGYAEGVGDLLDEIHRVNPDAVIAITGLPGMLADYDVQIGSIIIDLEKIAMPINTAINSVIKNAAEERSTYVRYIDISDMKHFEDGDYVVDGVIQFKDLMPFYMQNSVGLCHPSAEGCQQIAEKIVSNFEFKTGGSKLATVKNTVANLWTTLLGRIGVIKVQNFLDIFRQLDLGSVIKMST